MWRGFLVLACAALAACQSPGTAVVPAGGGATPAAGAHSLVASSAPIPAGAWQRIRVPLTPAQDLHAHWLPAASPTGAPRPAVLALHGCGGLYTARGALAQRYRDEAQRLHAAGVSLLLLDSFGSRGVQQICSIRASARPVHVAQHAQDARAALAWLVQQPGVDAQRMGVLGWSNGGTTALELLALRRAKPQAGEPALAGVAVFYPGCAPLLRRKAALQAAPLLVQLGALDDWTPPQPCVDLVQALQAQGRSDAALHVYADSYHGFDGRASVRVRADIPHGTSTRSVHQGGNPAARAQALAALDAFWARVLGERTPTAPVGPR